ncbi:MAG: DUF21 domain-containing protein [Phycisphaerales bacterium]|nr:DUF21 domain-containing protein [Phycisphaerales bacterium]
MIVALLAIGAIAALLASAFFSGAETGAYSINPVRLRVESEGGSHRARRLARLMERREDIVITTLVGTNIADYCATACVTGLLLATSASPTRAELITTAIVTPLVLVFGGVLPKDWFRREADRLMLIASGPLAIMAAMIRSLGLTAMLRGFVRYLTRWLNPDGNEQAVLLPRAQTVALLEEGAVRGGLSAFQRETMERVMKLGGVRVQTIMTPLNRAAILPDTTSRDDFLRVARMSHFSRIPIWRDAASNLIGVINVYDVLTDDTGRDVLDFLKPAVYIPPGTTAPAALLRLQQSHEAMAIVRDANGACIGLLTMKDLVEEIVGELEDW